MKRLNFISGGICLILGLITPTINVKAENVNSKNSFSPAEEILSEFQFELNDEGLTVTAFPYEEEVFIPESAEFNGQVYPVTTIGNYVSNSHVKILHIPSSVKSIDVNAFRIPDENYTTEIYSVEELYIESLESWMQIDFGTDSYLGITSFPPDSWGNPVNNDTKVYVGGELLTKLIFTEDTSVPKPFAFHGFKVDEIVFPESWKTLTTCAFEFCEVPELHIENIEGVNWGAFSGSKIQKIYTGPDLLSIEDGAFSSIKGLTDFYFESSPKLGEDVISSDYDKFTIHITEPLYFDYNAFLHSVYCVDAPSLEPLLSGSINNFEKFYTHHISIDGEIITALEIPSDIDVTGNVECLLIDTLIFGEGYERIGLVYGNRNLKFIRIPSTVTYVRELAGFYDGPGTDIVNYIVVTKDIEILAPVPPENGFDAGYFMPFCPAFYEECVIHVPAGCVEAYRNAPGWCNFTNITDEAYTSIDQINYGNRSDDNKVYDLNGRQVNPDNLQKGIYIQNGKKILVK